MYSFTDFEEAYYTSRWKDCKDVGLYLLKSIKKKEARKLETKLSKIDTSYLPSKESAEVLLEVKLYLKINLC